MGFQKIAASIGRRYKRMTFNPSLPEITPLVPRRLDALGDEFRLNLVTTSINPIHVFGGISTALKFFDTLTETLGVKCRIITTDAATLPKFIENRPDFELVDSSSDSLAPKQVVSFNDRAGKTLPVGKNDVFMPTIWWTAHNTAEMIKAQAALYGADPHPMIYFIQDYEPYFYPWSSQCALAEETYHSPVPTVAVINSKELSDYMAANGYSFLYSGYFKPTLNAALKKSLLDGEKVVKQKKLIVYGRPSTPRNCIELIAEGLRRWCVLADDAAEWQLVSAGEQHNPVTVGVGCQLVSVGKLSIEDYARLMKEAYAGLSLMVSPHPSYPPLEMSTFGVKTVTNRYANKDLSGFNENIVTLPSMTPDCIAETLHAITKAYKPAEFEPCVNPEYVTDELPFTRICEDIKAIFKL